MSLFSYCPSCGGGHRVPEKFRGKMIACKECQSIYTVGGENSPIPRSPPKKKSAEEYYFNQGVYLKS